VLGVSAAIGRAIEPEDDGAPGAHPVVMLSHDYWVRRFASDPGVLNQKVAINGHPMVVIGIAPEGFRGVLSGENPDVLAPIAMKRELTPTWDGLADRQVRWLNILARLKPGVSPLRAQAAMGTLYRPALESEVKQFPPRSKHAAQIILNQKLELQSAAQGINQLRQAWEKPLAALMALVGLVLLIACANVANLLLARATSRRREMAIRLALGAGRGSLVRQLLIESLVIALAGGLLGLLVSVWTTSALLHVLPADATGGWIAATIDGRLLLFTMALSVLTGLVFGLAPALQASRAEVASTLREQRAGLATGSSARFRRALVVGQLALSLLLLVGAGLFARSLINLLHVDPGFRTARLLQFSIDPRLNGYSSERGYALYHDLQERLARLPGVVAVGAANPGPLSSSNRGSNVTVEGYQAREDENMDVSRHSVSPEYFHALGIPVVRGREVAERDLHSPDKVVVVNEAFVKRFFGVRNPLGRRMMFGASDTKLPDREIVGVVHDFVHNSLREAATPAVFVPYTNEDTLDRMWFYVRGERDTGEIGGQVRRLVQQMDASLPVFGMQPLEIQVENSVLIDRLIAILSCAFGALATLLAAIGLYGVVAYTVARRTAEIGIRVALGAVPRDVLWLVMRDVGMLVVFGLAIGLRETRSGRLRHPRPVFRLCPRHRLEAPQTHLLQRRLPHVRAVRPRLDHQPGVHRGQSWRGGTRRHGRFGRQVRHHDRAFLLARRHPRHAVHGHFHDALLLRQQGALGARIPEDALRRKDPRLQRLLLRGHDHLLLGHLHVCPGAAAATGAGMEFRRFRAGFGGHRAGVYFPRRPHQRHI
jgi:predicted permease